MTALGDVECHDFAAIAAAGLPQLVIVRIEDRSALLNQRRPLLKLKRFRLGDGDPRCKQYEWAQAFNDIYVRQPLQGRVNELAERCSNGRAAGERHFSRLRDAFGQFFHSG
ncbi:hypothetical protein PDG61_31580 [Mycolicibacterium sp. BiH015]|uniref:hypothetical protein n=1 Tax=Mycolicibacterium sp. BiH015 TaxID=3018808 RepID=UPI0022E38984|nr:hypothetical protein [Mycolicibacterium sp. BiH015]MDA2895486.1 hypothetical protein [Mycolicibacterium sp. BiH015]